MMDNLESISNRLHETGQREFATACDDTVKVFEPFCESQIELMLLSALVLSGNMRHSRLPDGGDLVRVTLDKEIDYHSSVALFVQPQYIWRTFRIDFCISINLAALSQPGKPFQFFVECDGHEFHERTKEQAERDRARDREIQAAGISILRFTGREIFRDPFECVVEILDFISAKIKGAAA